jgi:hypothetical protein
MARGKRENEMPHAQNRRMGHPAPSEPPLID